MRAFLFYSNMETKIDRAYVSALMRELSQSPVLIYPAYTRITGKLTAGVALSQLVYWWGNKGGKEFDVSDAKITEQTGLSTDEWVAAKKLLRASGFVSISLKGLPARTHYDIHMDAITDAITQLAVSGISRIKVVAPKSGNQVSGDSLNCDAEIPETGIGEFPEHSYIVETIIETKRENSAPAHFADVSNKVSKGQPVIDFIPESLIEVEITGPDATKKKPSAKTGKTLIADLYTREAYAMAWDWTPFAKAHPHIDGGVVYDKLEAWSSSKGEKKLDWLATGRVWVQKDKSGTEFIRKATETVAAQVKMAQAAGYQPTQKEIARAEWEAMQQRNAAKGGQYAG